MQKEESITEPSKQKKKKKNKGWDNVVNSEANQEVPSQGQSNAVMNNMEGNVEGKQLMGMVKLECQSKRLSEMSKTYHVEMSIELGSGFASVVYLGENIHTKEMVCVKVIDYMALGGEHAKNILNRQIKYLKLFNCDHIVKLLDVYESPSFCYLIMEYCPGGDLFKFLMKSEILHSLFCRQVVQQICLGLIQLKNKQLIHRDLKSQNIFLGDKFSAKIGDLGFCVSKGEENVIHNVGSPIYMSPEVLMGASHSFQSDVYGLGVIWYELLHKKAPWLAKTEPELLDKKLTQSVSCDRPDLSEEDKAVILRCLQIKSQERGTVQQIWQYCFKTNEVELAKLKEMTQKIAKQKQQVECQMKESVKEE